MKAAEFVVENALNSLLVQLVQEGELSADQLLLDAVFENKDDLFSKATDFISTHNNNSLVPQRGKTYAPLSIVFVGPAKLLIIYSTIMMISYLKF